MSKPNSKNSKQIFIDKTRLSQLNKSCDMFLSMKKWCYNHFTSDELCYVRDKHGIVGVDIIFFVLIFYPIFYVWSFGFDSVPFPFNFLKKKNKKRDSVSVKAAKKKKKISKLEKDIHSIAVDLKQHDLSKSLYNVPIESNNNNINGVFVSDYDEYGRIVPTLKKEITILKSKKKIEAKKLKKLNAKSAHKTEMKNKSKSHVNRREKRLRLAFANGGMTFLFQLLNKSNWDLILPKIGPNGLLRFFHKYNDRLVVSLPASDVLDFVVLHLEIEDYLCVKYKLFNKMKLEEIMSRRLNGLLVAVENEKDRRDDL
jgi:hypothetical protein